MLIPAPLPVLTYNESATVPSTSNDELPAPLPVLTHNESLAVPSTSNDELVHSQISRCLNAQARRKFSIKPAEISPFSTIQGKTKKPDKPDQVSQLLGGKPLLVTSSPYKNELQEQQNKKQEKLQERLNKKQEKPGTSKDNTKKAKCAKKKSKTVQKTKTIQKNKKITKKN